MSSDLSVLSHSGQEGAGGADNLQSQPPSLTACGAAPSAARASEAEAEAEAEAEGGASLAQSMQPLPAPPEYSEAPSHQTLVASASDNNSESFIDEGSGSVLAGDAPQQDESERDDHSTSGTASGSSDGSCSLARGPHPNPNPALAPAPTATDPRLDFVLQGPYIPCDKGDTTRRSRDLLRATLKFGVNASGERVYIRDVTNETKTEENDTTVFLNGVVRTEHRITKETLRFVHEDKPMRWAAHTGESNTVCGDQNGMHAREGVLRSETFKDEPDMLYPPCLELLVVNGVLTLPQAVMMTVSKA
ncbi:glutamate synthase [NADH] [Tilletia horrida]|nr:glutamate synthase [NADH] [Tilletia horrida]